MRGRLAFGAKNRVSLKPKVNGHVGINGDVAMGEPDNASPTSSVKLNGVDKSGEKGNDSDDKDDSGDDDDGDGDSVAVVSIDRIAVSSDGQWLATSDSHARTHIFNLDSVSVRPVPLSYCLRQFTHLFQYHTTLPTFPRPAQTLTFDPMHPSVLLLAFPDNTIQIYDVEKRQFPVWGKDLALSLPRRFTGAHEAVLGVEFDPYEPGAGSGKGGDEGKTRYVLFWGSTWIFKASLDTTAFVGKKKKRRRDEERRAALDAEEEEERRWRDFKMITQYRPMLCCGFLGKDELVVVERPLVDVLMTLPPAYFRHKYGAS